MTTQINYRNHPQTLTEEQIQDEIKMAYQAWCHENRYGPAYDYICQMLNAADEKILAKMLENEPEVEGFFGPIERLTNAYANNPELGKKLDRVRNLYQKRTTQLSVREKARIDALTINEIEKSLP